MDRAGKFVDKATCTTCQFSEDFSNYWTAVMYFRAANGTYKRVPQRSNTGFDGTNGGMTVYYMQDPIMNFQQTTKVTAFRPVRVQRMIEIVLIRLGIPHDYRQSQCQHEGRIKEHRPGYLYLLGDLDDSVAHDQGLSKDTMQGRNYGQSFSSTCRHPLVRNNLLTSQAAGMARILTLRITRAIWRTPLEQTA